MDEKMQEEFQKKLNDLVALGKKNRNVLEQSQIDGAFDGMDLDDDQWEVVNNTIDKNGIVISLPEGIDDSPSDDELMDEEESNEADKDLNIDMDAVADSVNIEDPVRMYLKEIGKVPLLTADEEIDLAKRMEAGNWAEELFRKTGAKTPDAIAKTPDDAAWDEAKLTELGFKGEALDVLKDKTNRELKGMIASGKEAKNRLAEANLRLVVSIAKRYVGRGMLFLDLIQEGNLGLIKAVEKFDYRKGFKFSTYATWWIRQAITRAIADQARTIRVPVHMVETVNRLNRIRRQLTVDLGRDPTDEELAKAMDMPLARLHEIINETMEATSLDTPIGEEDDSSVGDFVADTSSMSPSEAATYMMMQQRIEEVLGTLTEREQQVLRMRFGLNGGEAHTLEEVGEVFGVTRERIRQIEAKALRKLRHPSRGKKLRDFIDVE